jgi:hypothetical protein
MIEFSLHQLYLLRDLSKIGCPFDLVEKLKLRCNCTDQEFLSLVENGVVVQDNDKRYWLSPLGKKEFKKQRVGKYF